MAEQQMEQGPRVAVIGLGATGAEIARVVAGRRGWTLARAVDVAPDKLGLDVAGVLGVDGRLGRVSNSIEGLADDAVDVAIVATVSRAVDIEPVITQVLSQGVPVVTVCEELSYPQGNEEVATRLEATALAHGVAMVATGANPGFIMDTLPLLLTATMYNVESVSIVRVADFSKYSGAVARFGLALTPEEFERAVGSGDVPGFLGFKQSIGQICHTLGWSPDAVEIEPMQAAAVAEGSRPGSHVDIPSGTVAEVSQRGRAIVGGRVAVDLRLEVGYQLGDRARGSDQIVVVGDNQTLRLTTDPGLESLSATAAIAANVAWSARQIPPGFHTTTDLSVAILASKGD